MDNVNSLRKLIYLAKRLGLTVELGSELNYIYKQGSRRIVLDSYRLGRDNDILSNTGQRQQLSSLAHELGHYIVATPYRRKRKDYGIPNHAFKIRSNKYKWDLEDVKAQMVQNELLKFVGAERVEISKTEAIEYGDDLMSWWHTDGSVITKFVIGLAE